MKRQYLALFMAMILVMVCIPVTAAPDIQVYHFTDFESNNGGYTTNSVWNWGTPTSWTNAYSGSNLWGTNIYGNYPNWADANLYSPVIDLSSVPVSSPPVYVYWRQNYILEYGYDHVYAHYRIDEGEWVELWHVNDGGRDEWTLQQYDISSAIGHNVQFRWRLTSDFSIVTAGYYIDDVMVATGMITPTTSVAVDPETVTLDVGDTAQLAATINPVDADYPDAIWTSNNESVATVDSNGLVTAVGPGSAQIRATTQDTSLWDYCEVTVNEVPVPMTDIIVTPNTASMVYPGDDLTLIASPVPDSPDDSTISWTSSDETIAIVDNGVVKAMGLGTVTITAYSPTYDGVLGTCEVTVTAAPIPVAGLTLDMTTLALTVGDNPVTINAIFNPANATNQGVIWTSSDESVARVVVNSPAAIHPIGEGVCTITATSEDGQYQATCQVTVESAEIPDTGMDASFGYILSGLGMAISMLIAKKRS